MGRQNVVRGCIINKYICGWEDKVLCVAHKKPTNAHIYYLLHSINTVSLRHVSALSGPSSGSTTDTFQQKDQQKELVDVKLWK
jgi:hypothetical protein